LAHNPFFRTAAKLGVYPRPEALELLTTFNAEILVTVRLTVLVRPALSVAITVIVLLPRLSETALLYVPPDTLAALPFTVTDRIPLASLQVPLTVIEEEVTVLLAAGDVIAKEGAALS
jgi:hypothetical protein